MLVRLIYTSRAPSPHPNDLSNILHTSRTMNPRFGITGALCFLDGAYMQYLEGEEPEVRALYAAIERDERHQSPRLLELTRIQVRFFPAWSMALLKWDERLETIFQGFATGRHSTSTKPRSKRRRLPSARWRGRRTGARRDAGMTPG